jgi:hypothetical protein
MLPTVNMLTPKTPPTGPTKQEGTCLLSRDKSFPTSKPPPVHKRVFSPSRRTRLSSWRLVHSGLLKLTLEIPQFPLLELLFSLLSRLGQWRFSSLADVFRIVLFATSRRYIVFVSLRDL